MQRPWNKCKTIPNRFALDSDTAEDIRIVSGIVTLDEIVTLDDLRKYKLISRKPCEGELLGMKIYLTHPPQAVLY